MSDAKPTVEVVIQITYDPAPKGMGVHKDAERIVDEILYLSHDTPLDVLAAAEVHVERAASAIGERWKREAGL